jgi:hypothetical protein
MVTAYDDDERRRAAEFLTKPVDFDLLKMRLRQLPNYPMPLIAEAIARSNDRLPLELIDIGRERKGPERGISGRSRWFAGATA